LKIIQVFIYKSCILIFKGKSSAFKVEEYINKVENLLNPFVSNSILFSNVKSIKMNKTQLTSFFKNFQHRNLLEKELEIIQQKINSR
jgi:hypothetical protein